MLTARPTGRRCRRRGTWRAPRGRRRPSPMRALSASTSASGGQGDLGHEQVEPAAEARGEVGDVAAGLGDHRGQAGDDARGGRRRARRAGTPSPRPAAPVGVGHGQHGDDEALGDEVRETSGDVLGGAVADATSSVHAKCPRSSVIEESSRLPPSVGEHAGDLGDDAGAVVAEDRDREALRHAASLATAPRRLRDGSARAGQVAAGGGGEGALRLVRAPQAGDVALEQERDGPVGRPPPPCGASSAPCSCGRSGAGTRPGSP